MKNTLLTILLFAILFFYCGCMLLGEAVILYWAFHIPICMGIVIAIALVICAIPIIISIDEKAAATK